MEQQHTQNNIASISPNSSSEDLVGAVGGMSEQCVSSVTTPGASMQYEHGEDARESAPSVAGTSGTGASTDGTGMDRLFLKQKNEIMFELRRLQVGDKPVSGKDSRQNLERFFTRNSQSGDDQSTAEPPEEHRPESVIVEVQGLVQQRRVSSILGSAAFRRRLENAVRGHISANSSRPSPPPQPRTRPAAPSPVLSATATASVATSAPLVTSASLSASSDSLNSILTANSASTTDSHHNTLAPLPQGVSTEQAEASPVDGSSVPPPPPFPAVDGAVPRAAVWLQQQHEDIPREPFWDRIEDPHREDLIMEITELVQQQLVTSSLHGEIGNSLESHLQNRAHRIGRDGQHVQTLIQSLRPSQPHIRNDFSHLGIQTGGAGDLDDISIISATAAVHVPYSQSQTAMKAEMHALRSQMKELQTMMKLSFDLQMDIQRSIRQEVAAALSQVMGGATVPQPEQYSRPVRDSHCIICLDSHADSVLYQCGHMCVCNSCGLQLQSRGSNCPVCRAPIRDVIRAYKSGND